MLPLLVVALLAAGCGGGSEQETSATPPKRHAAAVPEGFFGVNGQSLRPMAADGREELLDRHLDTLVSGGIDFVRVHAEWQSIEPGPPRLGRHLYDFDAHDAWMAALAEHGLQWQLLVVGIPTPRWAADQALLGHCGYQAAPQRLGAAVDLARTLVERYGREGEFWRRHPELPYRPVREFEIWNEPNHGAFWCPSPDPVAYARLLLRSARAIHAVDPRARVLFGGLGGWQSTAPQATPPHMSAAEFVRAVLLAEPRIRDEIDAVAVHAYGPEPDRVLGLIAWYRDALRALGLGQVPMVLNETGWYTRGIAPAPPATDAVRAQQLAAAIAGAAASDCGLRAIAPHTWVSEESDPYDEEDWYGIADPRTGEPYETGRAYLDEVLVLEGRADEPPAREPLRLCGGEAT